MRNALAQPFPGVTADMDSMAGNIYYGTAPALIAAGIVRASQLPGAPGLGQTCATFYKGEPVRKGDSRSRRDEDYLQVRRVGDRFRVQVGISAAERERRCDLPRHKTYAPWDVPQTAARAASANVQAPARPSGPPVLRLVHSAQDGGYAARQKQRQAAASLLGGLADKASAGRFYRVVVFCQEGPETEPVCLTNEGNAGAAVELAMRAAWEFGRTAINDQ